MRVEVSRYVFAPATVVWEVLTDWERQPEWMVDAQTVEILGERRNGVGVRMRVPTRVFGVTVEDVLEVTDWREAERLEARHVGSVIEGVAAFELRSTHMGTRLTWWEEIDPPLGLLGELAATLLARPLVARVFARSLDGLKRRCEREVSGTPPPQR